MNIRHRLITALLWIYPAAWRREYGPELSDILFAIPFRPRVIANVLASGLRQRAKWLVTGRLWSRALVAFVAMEMVFAVANALRHAYGPGRGLPNREFTLWGGVVFGAIVTVPYFVCALLGILVPATTALRRLRRPHTPATALAIGAALGIPAFVAVVFGGWMIDVDGPNQSLAAFVTNVARFPLRYGILLAVFAAGGAVVMAGEVPFLDAPRTETTETRHG